MLKKAPEQWEPPGNNWFIRFLSGIDFSLQVVLSTGIVILLCVVIFLVARDRYDTVDYMLAALRI